MAEPKFYQPFHDNDNFASAADSLEAHQLFITTRMLRGEHVTEENSGLTPEEWSGVMTRLQSVSTSR